MVSLERWGINALSKIHGMFAFCYIDQEKNEAYLVRDRFGQKPLYYSKINDGFIFASEMKAILTAGINSSVNYSEIQRFVNFSQYDNSEKTLFKKIKQLNSGDYIKYNLKNNQFKIDNWYDLKQETQKKNLNLKSLSSKEIYQELSHLLTDVCQEHAISDVPISLSLSGGLDSSTILALLANSNKKYNIRCNLINFEGGFSEEKFVKELTKKYNQKYFVNTYSKKNFADDFENLVFKQEGFVAGLHNTAFEGLYKHLSRNRMRVLLDGTGLDECFGGYRIHHLHYLSNLRINNFDLFNIKAVEFCKVWKISLKNLLKSINLLTNNKNLSIDGTKIYNYSLRNEHILRNNKYNKFNYKNLKEHYFDFIKNTKIPRNLRIKDRQSMSYSIETRLPFMDHRLIEFGLNFSSNEIFKFGFTKFPIRKIMEGKIPHQVLYSQKRDIQNPQTSWFREKRTYDFIYDCVSSKSFKERGFYDYKKALRLLKSFKEKGANNSFFILQWLNVEIWHQVYQDRLQINLQSLLGKFRNKKINLIKNEKKYL